MSWNTSFLLQKSHAGKGKSHFFENLGLPGGREVGEISFFDAGYSSLHGKAVAVIGSWTLAVDPTLFAEVANGPGYDGPGLFPVVVESRLEGLPLPSFGFACYGVSDTYGFVHFEAKRRQRLAITQAGRSVYDIGPPVYANDLFGRGIVGEDQVFGLLQECSGLSMQAIESASFALVEFDANYIQWVHS